MKLGTIGRRKAPAELYESLGIADYSPGYWNIANAHQSPEFLRWVDAGYLRKADAVPPGHKVREADALELETLNRTHPAPKPAARLSQADVVRLVFRGDKAAFERASDLNFPSAKLALIAQNGRRTLAWVESDISRWSETVAAVARAIGTRWSAQGKGHPSRWSRPVGARRPVTGIAAGRLFFSTAHTDDDATSEDAPVPDVRAHDATDRGPHRTL